MKKYIIISLLFVASFGIAFNYSYAEDTGSTTEEATSQETKQLKLNSVKVIEKNKLELEFDSNIDKNADNDISVKNVGNDDEIYVSNYKAEENKLILELEKELESNIDYEIIIFSVMGEDGSEITSGLDGAFKFNSGDLSKFDKQEEEKSEEENTEVELNSAAPTKTNTGTKENIKENTGALKQSENLAGKEISQEVVDKNIENVAAKKKELTKTGPEDTLLIILALILAGLIGYTVNQRKNNKI